MLTTVLFSFWGTPSFLMVSTPTPTSTPGPLRTPTPDFRARLYAEDRATQEAYQTLAAASGGRIPPLGAPTATIVQPTHTVMVPFVVAGNPTATATPISIVTEPVTVIHIPEVNNNSQPNSPLPASTEVPIAGQPDAPEEGGGEPTIVELPTEIPTEIPTETPTEIPTETPEPTAVVTDAPTATPTPFTVTGLRAFVTATAGVTPYVGPSTQYTIAANALVYNQEITLLNRDETGEWVAACCSNNVVYWMRQAYVPPRDNALQAGAPAGADPNDVRWLPVLSAPPTTEPILTPTAIPPDIFPFYRVYRGNNATVPSLPQNPLQADWPNPFQAVAPMSSPVLVTGNYVVAGSENNHIYALDRTFGNQQRSYNAGQRITAGPLTQDNIIYFVTQNGASFALNSELGMIWQSTANGTPFTPLYQAGNRLFVGVQESDGVRRIVRIDRINSGTLFPERYQFSDAQPLAAMAVGNQLLYVGDPGLKAVDHNTLALAWQQDGVARLTAPPVYVNHGVQALAELYVADEQNRLHLVDANTGRILWTANVGLRVTGLAVGPETIYASGEGFVIAWPRRNGSQLWRKDVPGEARGGPIVGPNRILIVTSVGNLRLIDLNGLEIDNVTLPGGVQVPAGAAPAVSGLYIFVPGTDGKVYAFRGQP